MNWAVARGIITGVNGGQLTPKGGVTRAQLAVMFQRFCENAAE